MKKFLTVLVILAAITFYSALRIQPAEAMGTIYIQADGSISPPGAPIQTLDGVKYILTANADASIVVQRSNIVLDGAFYNLQGDGTQSGFILQDVANITIKNTLISDCFDGIQLFNASDNTITGNTIIGSAYEGVGVYYSSGNVVAGNNITNNQIGISFYSSSSNSVVHNEFMNNTYQFYIESSTDNWDDGYPSGGNYWSDYSGGDTRCGPNQDHLGSDGMGDTPYTIDSNNTDRYPLMNPWTPPSGHNVAVISAVSSKVVIGQGFIGNLTVYGANRGEYSETFNVTVYANTTSVGSVALPLASDSIINIALSWNTTGFAKGNYTMSAYARPVPGETDMANNNFTGGWVMVSIKGDLTGGTPNVLDFVPDGRVDIVDVAVVARYFGQKVPPGPSNCDVSGSAVGVPDGRIDITDIATVAKHFGQH